MNFRKHMKYTPRIHTLYKDVGLMLISIKRNLACLLATQVLGNYTLKCSGAKICSLSCFVLYIDLAKPHLYPFTCMVRFCPRSLKSHPLVFVSLSFPPLYYIITFSPPYTHIIKP